MSAPLPESPESRESPGLPGLPGLPALPALPALRAEIEALDERIVALVAERVRLARSVGEAKRAAGVPTLDHAREAAVVRRAAELGRAAGLREEDVRSLFWHVIGISRRAQMNESP